MLTDDHDDDNTGIQRKREMASYLRGEAPAARTLACAPQLQGWRAVIVRAGTDDARPRLLITLVGRVTGHPRLANGRFIHTSEVIWLDRNRSWARSWNRLYRLGAPADNGAEPEENET